MSSNFGNGNVSIEEMAKHYEQQLKKPAHSRDSSLVTGALYSGSAVLSFSEAFIWGKVFLSQCNIDGKEIHIDGGVWGVGLGGGTSIGILQLQYSPESIAGRDLNLVLLNGAVAGGGVILGLHFSESQQQIGQFTGAALAVSAAAMFGSGKMTI